MLASCLAASDADTKRRLLEKRYQHLRLFAQCRK